LQGSCFGSCRYKPTDKSWVQRLLDVWMVSMRDKVGIRAFNGRNARQTLSGTLFLSDLSSGTLFSLISFPVSPPVCAPINLPPPLLFAPIKEDAPIQRILSSGYAEKAIPGAIRDGSTKAWEGGIRGGYLHCRNSPPGEHAEDVHRTE
jgi:hypothetical protein